MRILLLGKNGQVGWELQRTLLSLGTVAALDYPEVDFADLDGLRTVVRAHNPELIVNAAAYTAVDQAEMEPERAMAINGIAPGVLAEEAKRLGSGLVHYSTDYVFDGAKRLPYTEEDVPRPINVYGHTKLAGDRAVEAVGGAHLLLRTSWVYGGRGRNFFLTIRKLAREQEVLEVVDDQVGSPTWCRFLAGATAKILGTLITGGLDAIGPAMSAHRGVYNLSAEGQTTWCRFARAILEADPSPGQIIARQVRPISSQEHPSMANRPPYSVLCKEKTQSVFGVKVLSWEQQLSDCWASLA